MPYPHPPWYLQGQAYLCCHWLPAAQVRPLIPAGLEIISLWPGWTLGGVALADYQPGSVLQYHELIVVAGLVRSGAVWGPWISQIYVDDPDSVAGGQEVWGLPKQLAAFAWSDQQVTVSLDGQMLCRLDLQKQPQLWHQSGTFPAVSQAEGKFYQFWSTATARLGWLQTQLTIPEPSPLSSLGLGKPWLSLALTELTLTVQR